MKITYILEKFPSPTEYFILNEILQFEKEAVEIILLVLKRQKQHEKLPELKNLKATIIYLPWLHFYFPIIPILRSPFSVFRFPVPINGLLKTLRYYGISQYFAKKKILYNHIHAHFAFISVEIAYYLSKISKVNYSLTAHARDIYTNNNKIIRHLPYTKFLITCTEYNKNYLNKLTDNIFKDKILRVYHGISPEEWNFKGICNNSIQELQILAVARLVEKKGLIFLLKAIEMLINNGTKAHCTIIGQGVLQSLLEEYIYTKKLQNFIRIIPFVPQSKLGEYYLQADLFVLPCIISSNGDRDGLPNVIIEAMLSGLPVISTPVSAIPEVLKHKETGILVKEKDELSIVEGINLITNNQNLRQHIIKRARQEIVEKLDITLSTKQLIEIFRKNIPQSQP